MTRRFFFLTHTKMFTLALSYRFQKILCHSKKLLNCINALPFYRSQNVLDQSKFLCQTKNLFIYSCGSHKHYVTDSQIFGLAKKNWTNTKHFGICKRKRHLFSHNSKSIILKKLFLEKLQVALEYNICALTVKVILSFFFVVLIFCKTNSGFFFTFKQSNVIKSFVHEFYCFKTSIFLQRS